jgi:hypothetical protein
MKVIYVCYRQISLSLSVLAIRVVTTVFAPNAFQANVHASIVKSSSAHDEGLEEQLVSILSLIA